MNNWQFSIWKLLKAENPREIFSKVFCGKKEVLFNETWITASLLEIYRTRQLSIFNEYSLFQSINLKQSNFEFQISAIDIPSETSQLGSLSKSSAFQNLLIGNLPCENLTRTYFGSHSNVNSRLGHLRRTCRKQNLESISCTWLPLTALHRNTSPPKFLAILFSFRTCAVLVISSFIWPQPSTRSGRWQQACSWMPQGHRHSLF